MSNKVKMVLVMLVVVVALAGVAFAVASAGQTGVAGVDGWQIANVNWGSGSAPSPFGHCVTSTAVCTGS
ncbi:MAG: hypothetical protein D6706_12680 [Chloroflexi bacterium]|nr:MAG: hypothetical protein D6706_12680 [Chloroflexota bacterium]